MATQLKLDLCGKPAQTVPIVLGVKKSGCSQIHFACNLLQPGILARLIQHADGCRVAGVWAASKSINVKQGKAHTYVLLRLFSYHPIFSHYSEKKRAYLQPFTACAKSQ